MLLLVLFNVIIVLVGWICVVGSLCPVSFSHRPHCAFLHNTGVSFCQLILVESVILLVYMVCMRSIVTIKTIKSGLAYFLPTIDFITIRHSFQDSSAELLSCFVLLLCTLRYYNEALCCTLCAYWCLVSETASSPIGPDCFGCKSKNTHY